MSQPQTSDSPTGLALLCVDVQPVFLKVIADHENLERRCAFAIQAAIGLGIPVAFTEQVPDKLGGTSTALKALAPDAPAFPKTSFSALGDAAVRDWIASHEFEHLLLCGIETPVCVYQTALDALNANLQVTLLSDCIGARRNADASTCLDALIRSGIHVLPAETVFYSLLRNVSHPFFKAYTQLVKNYA